MKKINQIILISGIIMFIIIPNYSIGQSYQVLEPEVVEGAPATITTTEESLKYAAFAVKTLLALTVLASVIAIVIGGVEYMVSTIPGIKANGISRVNSAIVGLLLALTSYLILNVINPDLVNFSINNFVRVGEHVDDTGGGGGGGGGAGNGGGGGGGGNTNGPGAVLNGSVPSIDCYLEPIPDDCSDLSSMGVNVANWEGTNGPGRTDRVQSDVAEATLWVQQEMRERYNMNIQVTAAHTNNVGHSNGSQHYEGRAIDIQLVGGGSAQTSEGYQNMAQACRDAGFTFVNIEVNANHVHCDAR